MGMFQWGVRQSTEVENMVSVSFKESDLLKSNFMVLKGNGSQMTSVERVVEYTELESEAPWETKKRPPPDWPSKGMVTFDRVNFSYTDDGPLVLQNLKAMFRPQEKVGIVGRTGAGKSSLISALFRLAEPQGKIYIDGVLTSEIGLHDLRQKMSIIPQVNWCFCEFYYKSLEPVCASTFAPSGFPGPSSVYRHHEEEPGPFPATNR